MIDQEARQHVAEYDALVAALARRRRVSTAQAKAIVERECPGTHANYVAALQRLEPDADAVARIDQETIRQWTAAIEAKMQTGLSRMRATTCVAREKPDLHKKFLIATNRDQPSTVAHLCDQGEMGALAESYDEVIQAFDELVAAKMATGLTRRTAIASVAKRHPRLHELYLVATNRDRPGAIAHLV